MHPDVNDLFPGNIIETDEGNALLLERQRSWRHDDVPYVRTEIGEDLGDREPQTINWASQRWLVEFVSGQKKGLTTHRYIHYFHSINAYLRSGYDLYGEEE